MSLIVTCPACRVPFNAGYPEEGDLIQCDHCDAEVEIPMHVGWEKEHGDGIARGGGSFAGAVRQALFATITADLIAETVNGMDEQTRRAAVAQLKKAVRLLTATAKSKSRKTAPRKPRRDK